ncbi:MAG: adenylate/guanylate cyclase domain-containing protein [Leptospiraceae bacterium]|nr:adenylate/guanylate cyclase domain-containing protein [Leptospiraceae bacterium]
MNLIKIKSFFFLLIISGIFVSCQKKEAELKIENGILDLRSHDFSEDPTMVLSGEWKFLWNEIKNPEEYELAKDKFQNVKIPHRFQDVVWNGEKLSNDGYATYYLKIIVGKDSKDLGIYISVENTAYKLYINGTNVLSKGVVGTSKRTSVPTYAPATVHINSESEVLELLFQVSNFHNRYGGLRNAPRLGIYSEIKKSRELSVAIDMMVFGALLIIGIYQLCLYILRRNDPSTLYLGIYSLLYSAKTLFENERIFLVWNPYFPWEFDLKISYFATFSAPFLFTSFLYYVFQGSISKKARAITAIVAFILCFIVLVSQASVYSRIAIYHQFYIFALGFYGLIILIKSIREKREGAIVLLIGYILFFFLAGINDSLYSQGIIESVYLSSYALMVFILSQGIAIAIRFSSAFRKVEVLSSELLGTNASFSKFVPQEFLAFLGKKDIQNVQIGDQTLRELTILFSDIRSFTDLSEKMTPQENFNFVNSYLSRMNPVIQKNNGFIDKFIGDAIMAIFTTPEDAILSALEMIDEISVYNIHRERLGYVPIRIGIGINSGKVMMGTVGDRDRMSTTVIGDSVNLAARLESLTKEYKTEILISDFTYKALKVGHKFELREIDTLKVKGKSIPVALYECYNFDSVEKRIKKRESHSYIMTGLSFKNAGEYELAITEFEKALKINPEDEIPKIQIRKCELEIKLEE